MKHLHCLMRSEEIQDFDALGNSIMASVRLRSFPALRSAKKLGWKVTFGDEIQGYPDIVVIGKIGVDNIVFRSQAWIREIERVKESTKIYLDYTDHHLIFNSPMNEFYRQVIEKVDGCIVPSMGMAQLLHEHWRNSIFIIEDPIEIEFREPKKYVNNPVTLFWFGHSRNIASLVSLLSTKFQIGDHIKLIVLSDDAGLNYLASSNFSSRANLEFNLALWSLENMVEASKIADLCIIPSDLSNPKKMGVSSNRLITALALGLPTAADNLPSYREFEGYYCDLRGESFRRMLENPLRFSSMAINAQANLINRFSMSKIEDDWKALLLNSIS